jgi:NitT/TauT family transport system substrate-binding protein
MLRRGCGWSRILVLLTSACCAPAGCGPASPTADQTPVAQTKSDDAAGKQEELSLALNWFPEAEHGGYFAALVHGYYKDAGLRVKILAGGPAASVLQRVAGKQVHFGIENADRVLLARAQQADVVAVMSPLQKSPRAIMVHAESPFQRIDDLSNVTLAASSGATWVQYLKKKVPLRNVRFVPYSGTVVQFLVNKNYAQQAYVFSEPFLAEEKGAAVRCLLVAETGYNPYTSLLVTSGDTVRDRPELVRRFVAASVHGWQTYLERPEETNRYIHQINPEMGLEILAFGVKALRPLCTEGLPNLATLGRMSAERWKTMSEQLIEADVLTADHAEPLRAFTKEFLSPEGTSDRQKPQKGAPIAPDRRGKPGG